VLALAAVEALMILFGGLLLAGSAGNSPLLVAARKSRINRPWCG
jgi:hypothetical protein